MLGGNIVDGSLGFELFIISGMFSLANVLSIFLIIYGTYKIINYIYVKKNYFITLSTTEKKCNIKFINKYVINYNVNGKPYEITKYTFRSINDNTYIIYYNLNNPNKAVILKNNGIVFIFIGICLLLLTKGFVML